MATYSIIEGDVMHGQASLLLPATEIPGAPCPDLVSLLCGSTSLNLEAVQVWCGIDRMLSRCLRRSGSVLLAENLSCIFGPEKS